MRKVVVNPGNAALLLKKGDPQSLLFNSDSNNTVTLGHDPSISPDYGDYIAPLNPQGSVVIDPKTDSVYGVVPALQSATVYIYKDASSIFQPPTPGATPAVFNSGLKLLTGGGTITIGQIQTWKSQGFQGMLLDSLFPWDLSGLVFNGIQNWLTEARMLGSVGWAGHVSYNTPAFITTDTGLPLDGIQIFASNPSGNPTQGIIFRNCVFVGANPQSVFHQGGGERQCGAEDCMFVSTDPNVAHQAVAVAIDTGLSDNNAEDPIWRNITMVSSSWACLAIGKYDQTQHANDAWYYDLVTAGGQYSIVHYSGGNHTFIGWYDRSNPSVATVWNHGTGRLTFIGGEHQNNTGSSHLNDGPGQTILENVALTQAGSLLSLIVISAGSIVMRGACTTNVAQIWQVSGTGVIDVTDPAVNAANATINGSAGTIMIAGNYAGQGAPPLFTTWTGAIVYQGIVTGPANGTGIAVSSGTSVAGTTTVTATLPSTAIRFRVNVYLVVIGAGTNVDVTLSYNRIGGVVLNNQRFPFKQNNVAGLSIPPITAAGTYEGEWAAHTDASGTSVSLTITPSGGFTYTYSVWVERIT